MEVLLKTRSYLLTFDGRVLEVFYDMGDKSWRYHVSLITSIQLGPPDKHGMQKLNFKTKEFGERTATEIAPDQVGQAQELVAAVQQAMLAA